MNVACASHEYAVELIKETSDQLVLRVLTIASPPSMNIHANGKVTLYHHLECHYYSEVCQIA